MSDAEKEGLLTTRLGNLDQWITTLQSLGYKVGEIHDKLAEVYEDLLPPLEPNDPRREHVMARNFFSETPGEGEEEAEEPPDMAKPANPVDAISYHLRGILNASNNDVEAWCRKSRLSIDTFGKVIAGVRQERRQLLARGQASE